MNRRVPFTGWSALELACLMALGDGCGKHPLPQEQTAGNASATVTNQFGPSVTTKEQAIAIAKQEVLRRGWTNFRQKSCALDGDHWRVLIVRLPEVFGGHAFIYIPTNGGPIRYGKGM